MTILHGQSARIAAVCAALAIAAVVAFTCWPSRDAGPPTTSAPVPPSAAARSGQPGGAPTAGQGAPRTGRQQLANIEPELAALVEPSASGDYDDNPMAEVLRRVLANDPQLATFKYYHNRPLLDDAELRKYHALLSDAAVAADVKQDLLFPGETKVDQAGNIKRLMKIDYLREALEWAENPQREALLALVSEIILTDNYPADMTMDMRLSLSGNKLELYELLYDVAPDRAAAVVQSSKGTRLEPLIAHLATSIQTRKRLEAQLENEVRL